MIIGENYYSWDPNFIRYKDPEKNEYFGTAIGNTPLEENLAVVDNEADAQKQVILEQSMAHISEVNELSQKFVALWAIVAEVENAMTAYPWQG